MTILVQAQAADSWEACLHSFATPRLLIIDEFGYLPVPASASLLLFQVVAERYERGSILLTTNQAINDWDQILGDPMDR